MKITTKWLESKSACPNGIKWFKNQDKTEDVDVIKSLMAEGLYVWANWLIVNVMRYSEYVKYAVNAAESVIDIYENKYPNDNRPRRAIEAAKKCIDNPSKDNKRAAYFASIAIAENFENYASNAAANAAITACASVADNAAYAANSAVSADADLQIKILEYGISLLETKKENQ